MARPKSRIDGTGAHAARDAEEFFVAAFFLDFEKSFENARLIGAAGAAAGKDQT